MKKLNTIEECVLDVNFETDAILESFFSPISLVDNFSEILKLPLSQIPESVRKSDPNLKYQPIYEIRSKTDTEYKILLGTNSIGISLNNTGEYSSWSESFFPEAKRLFSEIFKSNKIIKIERIGLRYIDFIIDSNIFKDEKIVVKIDKEDAEDKKMFLRIEGDIDGVSYIKTLSNHIKYKEDKNKGSIVDIVTFIDKKGEIINDDFNKDRFFEELNSLHLVHTKKFKEVINDKSIREYGI